MKEVSATATNGSDDDDSDLIRTRGNHSWKMQNTITMIDKKLTQGENYFALTNSFTPPCPCSADGHNCCWIFHGLGTFRRSLCLGDGHPARGGSSRPCGPCGPSIYSMSKMYKLYLYLCRRFPQSIGSLLHCFVRQPPLTILSSTSLCPRESGGTLTLYYKGMNSGATLTLYYKGRNSGATLTLYYKGKKLVG